MTTYFDTTADKLMLPPSVRNHTELANVAALVEADVLAYFTDDPPYFLYTNQLGLQGFFDASRNLINIKRIDQQRLTHLFGRAGELTQN